MLNEDQKLKILKTDVEHDLLTRAFKPLLIHTSNTNILLSSFNTNYSWHALLYKYNHLVPF